MADKTIINNPSGAPSRYDSSGDAVGWVALAVIALLLILGAVYLLPRLRTTTPAAPNTGTPTNINVTVPGNAGGTGGATTPGGAGGSNY